MATFAIVEAGGKQYKIAAGEKITIEKVQAEAGADFVFDKVLLMVDGDTVKIGAPYLDGAKIAAKVVAQGRDDKKIIFRYHSKTRYRKKKGHRQPHTEIEIGKI
jgi:large subunit ribosomal protein L21